MTEEEKKAIVRAREHLINPAGNYLSDEEIETLLDLIDKQQRAMKSQEKIIMEQEKEIDKYKKQEFGDLFNGRYISKDKVLKALGYDENGEEYKRLYNKEELILSLIRTINEECDRLEDIEDQKTMLEIHNIENQRDKYWGDKIRDKIKELEEYQKQHKEGNWADIPIEDYDFDKINLLKELLEVKDE